MKAIAKICSSITSPVFLSATCRRFDTLDRRNTRNCCSSCPRHLWYGFCLGSRQCKPPLRACRGLSLLSRVQRVLFELADMPQTFFSLSLPLPSGLGSGLGSHMAAECPLPSDIYVEALESHLLLSCLTHLHGRSNSGRLPPSLSLRSRNDLVQEARRLLDPASYNAYIQYTLGLSRALPPIQEMPCRHLRL